MYLGRGFGEKKTEKLFPPWAKKFSGGVFFSVLKRQIGRNGVGGMAKIFFLMGAAVDKRCGSINAPTKWSCRSSSATEDIAALKSALFYSENRSFSSAGSFRPRL